MIAFITLYLVNFLRTTLVIAVIYYAIRLISRYIFPLLLDKGMKNMQQKMRDQQRGPKRPKRPEGEVTVQGNRQQNQQKNGNKGEYVDFEEVE